MNNNLLKHIASLATVFAIILSVQVCAHVEEFYWNGETVHLETPTALTLHQDGSTVILTSADHTGVYMLITTRESVAGMEIDQAVEIAKVLIHSTGINVNKVSKSHVGDRWFADFEGNSQAGLFLKARVILTGKNLFCLETVYQDIPLLKDKEQHAKFISSFEVKP